MPSNKRQTHKPPFRLPRRRSSKKSVLWAVAVSLSLHVPLFVVLPYIVETNEKLDTTAFDADKEFSLNVVDEEERDDEDQDKEREGQFISLPAPQKEERPDEARFLDQYDSRTDKEMARRDPGPNRSQALGRVAEQPADAASSAKTTLQAKPSQQAQPSHRSEQREEPKPPQPSEPTQQPSDASEEAEAAADLQEAETAEEGLVDKPSQPESAKASEQPSRQDARALFPSMESAQAALGGGSVDYLRDVEEGDKTLLNRKQSRYWSFMNRLKEQVVQEWSPGEEYRRRDPHGKVYGVKDRFTNLRITLNGDGSLRSIYVAKTSGLDFYDEEAVRAVRTASPFPNPPEGMKDQDGLIHINFGFVLDIHTGSMRNIRIRRR